MTELSPRDAEIQRRWLLGESSGVIGKHLHMTRNAVIGIVHRRGWQHYHASPVKLPYPEREAKVARRKPRIMPTERLEQPPRPLGSPRKPIEPLPASTLPLVPLMALTASSCRWTDCEGEEWLFCGAVKVPGLPYCRVHAARSYSPSKVRA